MKYTPREAAARRGDQTFQGPPCIHGHDGQRYVSNGGCVECQKNRAAARHARFKEIMRQAREGN